jgi:hypothetical protein
MVSIILEIMTLDYMVILIEIGMEVIQTEKELQDGVSVWGQP